ncbi:AraC family transcriptional regulator [Steroidobacter sp. S1-65]|uniref:AraC family transcriptional regulator n=2 Tax=Steroidobacter gossypii TaxID=2805490 RepID=A0ABS1WV39_9GAMM|nr:AraC family transcriptional regulator [Steroidobacter gossypii]MBM0104846.1 AraC family transcriptional regulator [Steroidobacter gossypii]
MKSLQDLIVRPELQLQGIATGDLLSQVLSQIRLTGDRVYSCRLPAKGRMKLEARAAHVCVLQKGCLQVSRGVESPATIDSGDLFLLPHDVEDLRIAAVKGPAALVVCRFWFDAQSLRAMLFALPWLIRIRREEAAAWLEGLVHYMLREVDDGQPGGALMISRLIDLIVIRTLRTWVHEGHAAGWLGGLADARVARALRKIHEQPLQRLGIEALASVAGMSRSSFSARFTALVGRSPLRYQNEWRLTLARDMLVKRSARVGEVGIAIGYESEAAFSRAYKAFFGCSPRADHKRSFRSGRAARE